MPTIFIFMNKTIRIETERLIIQPLRLCDAKDYFDFAKLDSVGPLAGWKPHKSILETKSIIRNMIVLKPMYEIPNLSLIDKESNKMIGTIELYNYSSYGSEKINCAELGYSLNPSFQHLGLMTEACLALIDYAFEETKLEYIFANVFVTNEPSIRLLKRINMTFLKHRQRDYIRYDGKEFECDYYMITKEDFLKVKYEKE